MSVQEKEVVAIGAGPSSLSLGVALEELAPEQVARRSVLLEQHQDVRWQRNLLLPWAESQVSFLKDLVTLRDPTSRFTFLSYLHEQGRLDEFINLGTFTPYRTEISGYLKWVAESLQLVAVEYNRRCLEIEPLRADDGTVHRWLVKLQDGSSILTRDVVVGTGRDPYVPEELRELPADRVIHSTKYLEGLHRVPRNVPQRVVVIGGAQSAAELFRSVHDDLPDCEPTIVMRSIGFGNYQTSKFINELFYPSYVDEFYQADEAYRREILREMRQTNYAGLAPGLLEELYRMLYLQKLSGKIRSRVITSTEVVGARMDGDEMVLDLLNRMTTRVEELRCDLLLLGTGFDSRMPAMVRRLAESLGQDEVRVDRSYRCDLGPAGEAGLYLQGVNEATHGISDSLLSVLAQRSAEIAGDILLRRARQPQMRSAS